MTSIVASSSLTRDRVKECFVAALRRQLRRRGLDVPFDEHDLIAEITR
jgi:hypothetical protein